MSKDQRYIFCQMRLWMLLPITLVGLTGCTLFGHSGDEEESAANSRPHNTMTVRYDGKPSPLLPFVYTTDRELTLTFDGMADDETMHKLLDALDQYELTATFFLPGMRVAEEPDLAREIADRGHEVENGTLDEADLSSMDYEQTEREIRLGNDVIQRETGRSPVFVREKSEQYNENEQLAAAQNGMKAVVGSSLYLHNWQGESEEQKLQYIRKHVTRGGIIEIDTEELQDASSVVPILAEAAKEVGYRYVPLQVLAEHGAVRKSLEQLPGYDAIKINSNYEGSKYRLIYNVSTNQKIVALTFDDWGTDYTVSSILDILAQSKIKATFFLRADGVEQNPNLAKAIVDEGHEVANHTYSHLIATNQSADSLQKDILRAHHVIEEAIQEKPAMLFRPPTGSIDDKTAQAIAATGFSDIAQFDIDPSDYKKERTADQIVSDVLSEVHSGGIILLHMLDGLHTEEALPTVVKELKRQGYTFVTMTDLIGAEND
ncbi:hypothetical protein PCCS19_04720 [Paenibacillus sp. CCS19]|uniref:polysaccharide deacetylase family protein n=1 Tax=Paenibacillus sp. CCS19 TaxID=3158387 RepID=UPI0025615F99|nr:polysaccharide deacetylase family protein [Paenibacillus cellulosilyticus]GMK37418.1 hypothetical protein PCCS19_04720 [Paenibacillus cellulosilyticus]